MYARQRIYQEAIPGEGARSRLDRFAPFSLALRFTGKRIFNWLRSASNDGRAKSHYLRKQRLRIRRFPEETTIRKIRREKKRMARSRKKGKVDFNYVRDEGQEPSDLVIASTAALALGSSWSSFFTFLQAYMTVVWSLPPNFRPISG